jgi:hypothetical protein
MKGKHFEFGQCLKMVCAKIFSKSDINHRCSEHQATEEECKHEKYGWVPIIYHGANVHYENKGYFKLFCCPVCGKYKREKLEF